MRRILDETFQTDFAAGARVKASSEDPAHPAVAAVDAETATHWRPAAEGPAWIEIDLGGEKAFDVALLQEDIGVGQRIESFRLEAEAGGTWREFARGTTVGYKRLLRFPEVKAAKVRLMIDEARTVPTLACLGLFKKRP
jgi:alpha-L-fucosidase